jgi:Archaeal fructose-1,6-bisphosphatase and related enzymes of inositol monophosphatase family
VSGFSELRTLAADIATRAGRFAAEKRLAGVEAIGTKSSVVDVVTQVDKDAEVLIAEFLRSERPDDGLLGEEGLSEQGIPQA